MHMHYKLVFALVALCLIMEGTVLYAQEVSLYQPGQKRSEYIEKAKAAEVAGHPYAAFLYYREAYRFDETDMDIAYRLAKAALDFQAYPYAEKLFLRVSKSDKAQHFPKLRYFLARAQQLQGKYQEARTNYTLYVTEHGSEDDPFTKRAKKEIEACTYAIERIQRTAQHIKLIHLGEQVNSPYSDFSPHIYDKSLYFTSLRFPGKSTSEHLPPLRSKVLSYQRGSETSIVALIPDDSSHLSVAHLRYLDANTRFFSVCRYQSAEELICKIYRQQRRSDGSWNTPEPLSNDINVDGYSSSSPALGYDKHTGQHMLFFVSNRPGGKGKNDIWMSTIQPNGQLSPPVNLQEINTADDDIAPYFDSAKQVLYFSSEGYLGLGGFDIYKSYRTPEGWSKVQHLPPPLNSSYHDIHFIIDTSGTVGYLASNRRGSQYLEEEVRACCYDIWKVRIQPCTPTLRIHVLDADTRKPLEGAQVVLEHAYSHTSQSLQKTDVGQFQAPVECGESYRLKAHKDAYLPVQTTVQIPAIAEQDTIVERYLFLAPAVANVVVELYDATTRQPLLNGNILVRQKRDLKTLHNIQLTASHRHTLRLAVGDSFIIQGRKYLFQPSDTSILITDSKEQRIKLYLHPSLSLGLPLTLYFDNDQPDARTMRRTTRKTYTETYRDYLARKNVFIQQYGLGTQKLEAQIEDFFDNKVTANYQRFQQFLQLLKDQLQRGNTFELQIKGFASPRATPQYNKRLAMRRVHSIVREIEQFDNGALLPYIKAKKLIIRQLPIGEVPVDNPELENLDNERISIYSPQASEWRKVEIHRIIKNHH